MPQVKFTKHLTRFFPEIKNIEIDGNTVAEIIGVLDENYPGLSGYIIDEQGKLRQHVNIFIDEELIQDRVHLSDKIQEQQRMFIFQALSGG